MPEPDKSQSEEAKTATRWPFSRLSPLRSALLAMLLMMVALVATAVIYLQQAGGLQGVVETQLQRVVQDRYPNADVAVRDADIELRLPSLFLTIIAVDVTIEDGQSKLEIPQADLVFSPLGLLSRKPFEIGLDGMALEIITDSASGGLIASPATDFLMGLSMGNAVSDDADLAGDKAVGHRLRLTSARVRLRDAANLVAPLHLDAIDAYLSLDGVSVLNAAMSAERVIDGQPAGSFELSLLGDPASGNFNAQLLTNGLVLDGVVDHLPMLPRLLSSTGSISGRINASIRQSELAVIDMDVATVAGLVTLPAPFPVLEYDTASIIMTYHRDEGTLSVVQSELVLGDGRTVALTGEISGLDGPRPLINGRLRGNQLALNRFYEDWPDTIGGDTRAALQKRFSGGQLSDVILEVSSGLDVASKQLEIFSLDLRTAFKGVAVDLAAAQYERLRGIGDGDLSLSIARGGVISKLEVAMGVSEAMLSLADLPDPVAVSRLQATGALQNDRIVIDDLSLALQDGGSVGLSGSFTLGEQWSLRDGKLSLVANGMEVRRFHAIWPSWAVRKTRDWVDAKMLAGRVDDVRLDVISEWRDDRLRVSQIDGSITVQDAHLELGKRMPGFTNVDGRLKIADNAGEIILTDGRGGGLVLNSGKVEITPIIGGKPALATTDLQLQGDIGDAIAVARQMGMLRQKGEGYDPARLVASGQSDFIVRTAFPVKRRLPPNEINFDVEARVAGGQFDGLPLGAVARDAELVILARRDGFSVAGSGRLFNLPTDFKYQSHNVDGLGEATLSLNARGALDHLRDISSDLAMSDFGAVNLADIDMAGNADLSLLATFPTGRKLAPDDIELTLDIVISDGSFGNLPGVGRVSNAELVATFSRGGGSLSGAAELFSVPSDLLVQIDRSTDSLMARVSFDPSENLAALAAERLGLDVAGRIGGNVVLNGNLDLKDISFETSLDFEQASLSVPTLGWAKLPGESGTAAMKLLLKEGRLRSIEDINIEASSLGALGRVVFDAVQTGPLALRTAAFTKLAWPGNDVQSLTVNVADDGSWELTGKAKLIDLVPLRRNRGIGEGRAFTFDFLADRIVVGDGIALSGQIEGYKRTRGGGKADFSGDLTYKNRPLITEAQLSMRFGSTGDRLTGAGIVGGAETTLLYRAPDGKNPELVFRSKNGGGTLNGLGITDTVRSGDLLLTTTFIDGYSNFNTDIRITNFSVVEAPRAVRAFSVLGPVGLLGLIQGEGTQFGWGEARLERRGPSVRMTRVVGQGQAVSVAFVGKYNLESRQVDISGNLVPASFLSRVVGIIPLVGEILTGVDNAGLFVTQFSMKGDIDDPSTSVTPASLIPGVLRDLFSPSWLEREGERILGPSSGGSEAKDAGGQMGKLPDPAAINQE